MPYFLFYSPTNKRMSSKKLDKRSGINDNKKFSYHFCPLAHSHDIILGDIVMLLLMKFNILISSDTLNISHLLL